MTPREFIYSPPSGDITVLHVDDDILVVDKPSGLLSVPGKAADHKDCLESRLQTTYPKARIVHRLDMDTSGIMVLAMNKSAHRHLGLQFERRHVAKQYEALVAGRVEGVGGQVDLPLICDWPNRPRQHVDHENGKSAITDWSVLDRYDAHTHLELRPLTGRSHQLRVHCLELGHPILGDNLYAPDAILEAWPRLALHACGLEIFHPDGGRRLVFNSAAPF